VFSKVGVVYRHYDFYGVEPWPDQGQPPFRETSQTERIEEAALHHWRFEILCEVRKARNLRLVLRANVGDPVGEYVRMLKEAVAEEKAQKGFEKFLPEPLVTYRPWSCF